MIPKSTHLPAENPDATSLDVQNHPITRWFEQFKDDQTGKSAEVLCHHVISEMEHVDDWSPDFSKLMLRATGFLGICFAHRLVYGGSLSPQ